jgi:hypothetical protein
MSDEIYETYRTAFTAAVSFHEVGLRCLHPAPGLSIEPFPMIVNVAFACELYLKVGLIASGRSSSGHNLDNLFQRLPEVAQLEIESIYEQGAKDDDVSLRDTLPEIGQAFIVWRYPYERQSSKVRHGAMLRLAQSLLIWLCRNYPTLPMDRAKFEILLRA